MAPQTASTTTVSVTARTVTGVQHRLELPGESASEDATALVRVRVAALYAAVATATSASSSSAFSLVHRGATVPPPVSTAGAAALARLDPGASSSSSFSEPSVLLSQGDVLVIVPRRAAPTDHARRAAAAASSFGSTHDALLRRRRGGGGNDTANDNDDEDDEDEELRHYRPPADAYAWERRLGSWLHARGAPPLALAWLFLIRPWRLVLILIIAYGARIAHNYGWGPPYVLFWLIAAMLLNLGRRKEGEASAYSLFNQGLRRLPGQLDAAQMDAQIRAGGGL
jgi:hypothetical protein